MPAVSGSASCSGWQRAFHFASKASREQIDCGKGHLVFKEYANPCRVKNSNKVQNPDLGAFGPTTSSTAPSGVIKDSSYWHTAASPVARTT